MFPDCPAKPARPCGQVNFIPTIPTLEDWVKCSVEEYINLEGGKRADYSSDLLLLPIQSYPQYRIQNQYSIAPKDRI